MLRVRSHLAVHITVGLLLVPPVLLKLATATWRMLNYYRGASAYRRPGAPRVWLGVLGPGLAGATLLLLASGIVLAVGPSQLHSTALTVHKVSFYVTLLALAAHLYGHLAEAIRVAAGGLARRRPHLTPSARAARGARWSQAFCWAQFSPWCSRAERPPSYTAIPSSSHRHVLRRE